MAHITLTGTLLTPAGKTAYRDQIRFTHKSTTGETVRSSVDLLTIIASGFYYIELEYGLVLIEYKSANDSQFKNLGVATVNGTNPSTSIPELLNGLVPVSSAELIQFQAILADAVTAKNESVTARNEAEAFANSIDLINDLSQAYIFDTVAAMKASTIAFPVGKSFETKRYYTSADGGAGKYLVVAAQAADGYGDHALSDGKVAVLTDYSEVNVLQFGAKRDDVAFDNQPAIQAALDTGVGIYVPLGTYYTLNPLLINSSAVHRGAGNKKTGITPIKIGTEIINQGNGDCVVYSDTVTIYDGVIEDIKFVSTTGHALLIGDTAVRCKFTDVSLHVIATNKACLAKVGVGGGLYSCIFDGGEYTASVGIRTSAIIDLNNPINVINSNTIKNIWVHTQSDVQAINVEITEAGGYLYNNVFENVVFEVCSGGAFSLAGNANTVIRNCVMWDTPLYKHDIILVKSISHPAYRTVGLKIDGYTRAGDAIDVGVNDISIGNSVHTEISGFSQTGVIGSRMNLANVQCTVIGGLASEVSGSINLTHISGANIACTNLILKNSTITDEATKLKISNNLEVNGSVSMYGGSIRLLSGVGTPEGAYYAGRGSIYMRTDGTNATTMYVKMSDSSLNTLWVAHAP